MTEKLSTLFLKGSMTLTYDHNSANAFAGTFAFLPTLDPTQKNQKSLQATAQGQCKFDKTVLRPKKATSANTGLAKVAVQCSASTFVVKIATFAKPETVMAHFKRKLANANKSD